MTALERVPTGIPGLDLLTRGGIPKHRATLITGRSGTGKSVLCLQLACTLARAGMKVLIIAAEEAASDLSTTGDAMDFGFSELSERGLLRVADFTPTDDPEPQISGDYDISGLIHRIRGEAESKGLDVVVIDSFTALFGHRASEDQLRQLFLQLVCFLRKHEITAVITAGARDDYGALTALGVEDFVCDLVITLRNTHDGERRRRSIEIHKYRRSGHYKGEYSCAITTHGISVFPLDPSERAVANATDRFSSGVEGLDRVNAGGWLRDSLVLVRGPTGSGKTILASMYARAGVLRGERVIFYGFEEPRGILFRNLAQIGLGFEELARTERLRVRCRFPDATSPEDLLIELRVELETFQPSLVVIDSVSALEHASSAQSFRLFMVGLASLLRQYGQSALLTQTVRPHDEAKPAAYLSTIADSIVMLDYTTGEVELLRSMRVLKMRGSAHSTRRHALHLGPEGLVIDAGDPRSARA